MSGEHKHHQLLSIIILLILCSPLHVITTATPPLITQIDSLPQKQKIELPIDTSLPESKYQPIDIYLEFTTPAWAQNETIHSVRIGYETTALTELESQIYNLQYTDENHIRSCNIVFLIPSEADGTENYYALYDTNPTEPPTYPQHVRIEDTHYFYEPLSGQKVDFDYYKIIQENYVIYGIIQQGVLLGEGVSHTIIKLKPNSTEFETVNTDQFGVFALTYNIDGPLEYTGSARATTATKSILVQGNLMIRVRISSTSPENTVTTDAIYTYYYCPTSDKRIDATVNHQVHKTIELGGHKERDVYLGLTTFKSRSATIENMNVGTILPSIHTYTEDGVTMEYAFPPDPDSEVQEWLLGTTDDVDLGEQAWVCLDDPATGKAHGLILEKSTGYIDDESDGFQIKASVKQVVKLPGLEVDDGSLYLTRNSYESGTHTPIFPEGLNLTFRAEFFTTETGGYETVSQEAMVYQHLIATRTITTGNVTTEPEDEEHERYTLTATVHFEPTFPLGAALSAVVGKRFSYLYAELYLQDSLISSGSLSRLPLSEGLALDFDNTTVIQKIKLILGLFDWRNISLFKRIRFPNLSPGTYLIKIYEENVRRKTQHQYIGFSIVDVTDDTLTRIIARPQATIECSVTDSNQQGIANAYCALKYQDTIIAHTTTDENGTAVLNAPCYNRKQYVFQTIYQGFLVEETPVTLRSRNQFRPLYFEMMADLYSVQVTISDTWELPFAVDTIPLLSSDDMVVPQTLKGEKRGVGEYAFSHIFPAQYHLLVSYKSFEEEVDVDVSSDTKIPITLAAEYTIRYEILDSYGMNVSEAKLTLFREGKQREYDIIDSQSSTSIPPADYTLTIAHNDEKLASLPLEVRADKTLTIVTNAGSSLHLIITLLGIIILLGALIRILWNKRIKPSIRLFVLGFLVVALVVPWWGLTGSDASTQTSTTTLLVPPKLITFTTSGDLMSGEVAAVPAELTIILSLISYLLIGSCILVTLTVVLYSRKYRKTSITLNVLSTLVILVSVLLFYVAMLQLTEVGVGSIIGSGDIDATLPGASGTVSLPSSWGLGIGFYLTLSMGIVSILLLFEKKILRLIRKLPGLKRF